MLPTYTSSLLQTRAYRALRTFVAPILADYQLTPIVWNILGLLYEEQTDRSADIATRLGVEPPLITAQLDELEKKGLVKRISSSTDKRAKTLLLTRKAKLLVPKVEAQLQKKLASALAPISESDLQIYIAVLKKITTALQTE